MWRPHPDTTVSRDATGLTIQHATGAVLLHGDTTWPVTFEPPFVVAARPVTLMGVELAPGP